MNVPAGHLYPYETDPLVLKDPAAGTFLVIPRRDIERLDLEPLLRLLTPWTATKHALNFLGGRLIPVIDGYNADPRDVDQIPEIRAYFEALEERWPHLPFFLKPDVECQSLYWMLVGDGRRSPDGSERINFGDAKKALAKKMRFVRETPEMLHAVGAVPGEREFNTLDAAFRTLADLLENRGTFIRKVD